MGMRMSPAGGAGAPAANPAWQQRRQQMDDLSKALSSDNLDAAKSAFAALAKSAPAGAASNPNSPLAQLGKALQSGDLAGAQQTFSAMRSHHRQAASGAGTFAGASSPPPPPGGVTDTLGNNLNVVA